MRYTFEHKTGGEFLPVYACNQAQALGLLVRPEEWDLVDIKLDDQGPIIWSREPQKPAVLGMWTPESARRRVGGTIGT